MRNHGHIKGKFLFQQISNFTPASCRSLYKPKYLQRADFSIES
jgi:hypothetical protein